ncbi:transcriptional regulator [Burkholderia anthina]|uniref:transcriptional regulator n=1 Tax=Burkholderia anthina TaxID=179879 RepID=UPI00158B6FBB|nr:Cro/CI family transcriptional regulator [Burkholderia anthina]
MDLRTYLSKGDQRQREFADALGVSQGLISQWARGKAVPPPGRCVAIERLTYGEVTRQELRPEDWRDIWPELVEAPANTENEAEANTPRATTP